MAALPGVMPTPIDSIEEFKVSTTNQTADFNSSAGSQVSMVTKRGTNAWHGTGYEYYLDNNWSANTFDNNAAGVPVPSYHYSRFGIAGGGPIIPKEILGGKTYFFANYEGFRWPQSETVSRDVPTASMRAGLLFFGGQYYNLNPTAVTFNGTAYPGSTLDPRGIGINSQVAQMWSTMPLPNATGCNGLSLCDVNASGAGNVGVFTGNMAVPQTSNFGVARLDHDFGSKWHFMSSYRYYNLVRATDSQIDITGGTPVPFLLVRRCRGSMWPLDHQYLHQHHQRLPLQLSCETSGSGARAAIHPSLLVWAAHLIHSASRKPSRSARTT